LQTGNAGKWKTPHQLAKAALHPDAAAAGVQPGDSGIWVTCARHQEAKAAREVGVLFDEVRFALPLPLALLSPHAFATNGVLFSCHSSRCLLPTPSH
jgi:hypothetical protein